MSIVPDNIIKYNVFYNILDSAALNAGTFMNIDYSGANPESTTYLYTIDSNSYHDTNDVFLGRTYSTNRNLAQWQAWGYDANSDTTDPGLTDPANGDFSRPGASAEMEYTYPNGWEVSRFGAWQPAAAESPPKKYKAKK